MQNKTDTSRVTFPEAARLDPCPEAEKTHTARGKEMTLEIVYKGRLAHRYKNLTAKQAYAGAARWCEYFGKLLGSLLAVRVISDASDDDIRPP